MPQFTADFSSSTASTTLDQPQRRRQLNSTPALASTTPLAPPPSKVFGSSQIGTGVSKLRLEQRAEPDSATQQTSRPAWDTLPPQKADFSLSTFTQQTDDMEEDEQTNYSQYPQGNIYPRSSMYSHEEPDLLKFSTRSGSRSTRSSQRMSMRAARYSELTSKGNADLVPGYARDVLRSRTKANVEDEADDIILETNEILKDMAREVSYLRDKVAVEEALAEFSQVLQSTWQYEKSRRDDDTTIGPGDERSDFEKASYLSTLILQLHSPQVRSDPETTAPALPGILLDWLNENHMGYQATFRQVMNTRPNVTHNEFFWDLIQLLVARGKIAEVIELLGQADFNHAMIDDGFQTVAANYSGSELQAIHQAVHDAKTLLSECPAVADQNFKIDGAEWISFRRDVEDALDQLHFMAEQDGENATYESTAIQKSGSKQGLPYDIYTRLVEVYHILLGSTPEIIAVSGDWLEAAMLLTIWWNKGTENQISQWSFDVSRAQAQDSAASGVTSYLNRLREAFLAVNDPTSKNNLNHLDSSSVLEVAVGSILQGDLSSALSLIQTLSQCLCSALAEAGAATGWFNNSKVPNGLDQDDLMVLTTMSPSTALSHDNILATYAQGLLDLDGLSSDDGHAVAGWQIAFSVLSRLHDAAEAKSSINTILDSLTIEDDSRAERLVSTLRELDMQAEARRVSETFGDFIVNSGTAYGRALLCYARAHSEHKVRQLVDLLSSYCLVESRAYPSVRDIDSHLENLVSNPRQAFASMNEVDPEAVETMQFYLVGYACIRRYFITRDDSSLDVSTRKKACVGPLLAAINSASDSIYGGLYDSARQTAVQADSLLPLLGETTAIFQDGSKIPEKQVFTAKQLYDLLAAIEDLTTVSDLVFSATEECLLAALRHFSGSSPPSPHAMLKKSMSSGTSSNFSFSMMGSEMLARSGESLGSAVLVGKESSKSKDGIERGWDWRANFASNIKAGQSKGQEVIRSLRFAIAQELSRVELREGVL